MTLFFDLLDDYVTNLLKEGPCWADTGYLVLDVLYGLADPVEAYEDLMALLYQLGWID